MLKVIIDNEGGTSSNKILTLEQYDNERILITVYDQEIFVNLEELDKALSVFRAEQE